MKKRIFSLLMAVVLLCGLLPMNVLAVRAEDWPYEPPTPTSGNIGQNISWKVDTSTGIATFTGSGDMSDWTDRYNYPDYLEYAKVVVISEGITSIGSRRFASSKKLEKVILPGTVTEIGDKAFSGCSHLAKVEMGDAVTKIGANAFNNCAALVKINLPDSITQIGEYAFYGCTGLPDFDWPKSLQVIDRFAFYGCTKLTNVVLPDGLEKVGNYAFAKCSELQTIYLPSGMSYIGDKAFEDCTKLDGVILPDGLTYLGESAFSDCDSLTKIVLPEGFEEISNNTFSGCGKLTTIYIPESVYFIGCDAFAFCTSLNEIYYGGSEADWANISILKDENYHSNQAEYCCTILKYATKYYNCTGPDCVLDGHTEAVLPAVEATCTTAGKTEGSVCSVCGKTLRSQTVIPMKGHDYAATIIKEVTCSEAGVVSYVCQNDKSHTYTETVGTKPHTTVVDSAVAATCVASGKTEGKHCSVCNAVIVKQETVPAKGHSVVIDQGTAATCDKAGKTEGKHCSVCNAVLTKQEVIPAKGHKVGSPVKENVVAATCETDGEYVEVTYCTVCEMALSHNEKTVPATGHKDGDRDYMCDACGKNLCTEHKAVSVSGIAATCTKDGLTEGSKCGNCGEILTKQEIIPAEGHIVVIENAVAATCSTIGFTEGKRCGRCDEIFVQREIIPTKGHVEAVDKAVAATCTKAGLGEGKHCSVCNTVLVKQAVIPAKGHTAVIDKAVAATCTKAGLSEGKHCSVCNAVLVKQETVPVKAHTPGGAVKEKTVAASCGQNGSYEEVVYCSVCKAELSRIKKTVPAVGHKDADKDFKCDACGAKMCTNHKAVTVAGYAATCIKEGLSDGSKCGNCGEVLKKQEAIPAKGHSEFVVAGQQATCVAGGLTDGVACFVCQAILVKQTAIPAKGHIAAALNGVAPTCVESGLTDGVHCAVCGFVMTAQEVIPAKGHEEVVFAEKAPTCTEEGFTEGRYCRVCNAAIVVQNSIPAKGHEFEDGICGVCGTADPDYEKPVVNPFVDVKDSDWFFDAVLWAVANNITGGTTPTTFSPNQPCTRAQVVQFLWAANGRPQPVTKENPFTDVSENDWYFKAVLWAVEQGITGGTSATTFSPDQPCTRAQVVTFLYAAEGKPEVDGVNFFSDVPDDAWYVKPVIWAVQRGITSGVGEAVFGPDQTCTRGQIALFLYKAMGGK